MVVWGRARTIPILLLFATLLPILALGWLGFRVLEQEHALERQREKERLEFAAGRLALAIERRLEEIEAALAKGSGLYFSASGVEGGAMLYQPAPPLSSEPLEGALADAEKLEFSGPGLDAAAAAYRQLVKSPRPDLQAAALVRLARVERKRNSHESARQAYRRLLLLGPVTIHGQPAELVARQGLCRILEDRKDSAALRLESEALGKALYSGSFRIDRATFELYREMVERWSGVAPPGGAIARTEAAIALWREWRAGQLAVSGRQIVNEEETPVLAIWTGGPSKPAVWLATPAEFEAAFSPLWKDQGLSAWVQSAMGQAFLGSRQPGGVTVSTNESRLPFLLGVARLTKPANDGLSGKQAVLLGGLLLTVIFTLAAAYGLYRATSRETALARQQADFVSAVSHEFRTPLTSMRHLTEMLVSRGLPSEERRAYYYQLLATETERLHRMVESLLSFGRIEAGAYAWRLEQADPRELVCSLVEEFRGDAQWKDRELSCDVEPGLPRIRADREALTRALWNLIENAAKYSPPSSPIRVFARRSGDFIQIGVEDHGNGIPPVEQAAIFQKFIRGTEAKRDGIRGVGIGLALVKKIAEAHGGSVELVSEVGRGSTFTLVLPCHSS